MHTSFLRHSGFRDLWLALFVCVVSIAAYSVHDPIGGPNGGTWLGYTLGGLGAFIILTLSWFGVRKRRFRSRMGTVKGWLSVHVWLGLSLMVIVTLHTGFQFGWNLHTLAYALMVLVVTSGLIGAVSYSTYPALITTNQAQSNSDAWIDEVTELNEQALKLSDRISPEVHRVVERSARRMNIGGGLFRQVFGVKSNQKKAVDMITRSLMAVQSKPASVNPVSKFDPDAQSTVVFMASQLAGAEENKAEQLRKLLDILGQRRSLVEKTNKDITYRARMRLWLWIHVPATVGLLAALIAHVVAVFLYW